VINPNPFCREYKVVPFRLIASLKVTFRSHDSLCSLVDYSELGVLLINKA